MYFNPDVQNEAEQEEYISRTLDQSNLETMMIVLSNMSYNYKLS